MKYIIGDEQFQKKCSLTLRTVRHRRVCTIMMLTVERIFYQIFMIQSSPYRFSLYKCTVL